MAKKRCVACGSYFKARTQVPNQTYCSDTACQRKRRQAWQQQKLQTDPDHRDNKSRAQQAWVQQNSDYWRQYRESHPEYVERNRSRQRERNAKRASGTIAKKDESALEFPSSLGTYRIRVISPGAIVKKDVCTVEITAYTCHCSAPEVIAKVG